MNIKAVNNWYVVAKVDDDTMLVYNNFGFYLQKAGSKKKEYICSISASLTMKIAGRVRLANRILRLEPRAIAKWQDGKYLVSMLHTVFVVDIIGHTISNLDTHREGFSTALNFCFSHGNVYWGDYGKNTLREQVNIYRLDSIGNKTIVYTFPAGAVRHIHNIIYDSERNGFWILTGDIGHEAGIYYSDIEFNSVNPIAVGDQQYRAVIGFPTHDGFIYATDAVDEENFLYHLKLKADGSYSSEKIISINGSCIFGTQLKDYYIFSTTVEPPISSGLKSYFYTRTGKGIKSRDVHIISMHKKTLATEVIASFRKDIYPFKLCQYGCAQFPYGQETGNKLMANILACKHYDGKTVTFNFR